MVSPVPAGPRRRSVIRMLTEANQRNNFHCVFQTEAAFGPQSDASSIHRRQKYEANPPGPMLAFYQGLSVWGMGPPRLRDQMKEWRG